MDSKTPTSSPEMDVVPGVSPAALQAFNKYLLGCGRILALCGAGLSASSGLPTFRGAGGLWRTHDAMRLATPTAFNENPGLVWQFYSYRRHMALGVKPNGAHYALAELAKQKPNFLCLTQNVDGLSPRAGHPEAQLKLLHGSLFDVKCSEFFCDYLERNNFTDPIVPALAIPTDGHDPTTSAASTPALVLNDSSTGAPASRDRELDISDAAVSIPTLSPADLPQCPKCRKGHLRPGVVWFGEALPTSTLKAVDNWIHEMPRIDLILVVGTSATVYPAAGYVDIAREKGARVAVVNMSSADVPAGGMREGDWFFEGDASVILPVLLKGLIGDISGNS